MESMVASFGFYPLGRLTARRYCSETLNSPGNRLYVVNLEAAGTP